jgi:biopolymer transport protein TolQ
VHAVSAAASGGGESLDILSLLMNASGVVMAVLFLLISLSVVSWWIIGYKALYYARAVRESLGFLDAFWKTRRYDQLVQESEAFPRSPLAQMFRAGFVELSKVIKQRQTEAAAGSRADASEDLENIERALRRSYTSEMTHLEGLIPFLATTGSAAPFVGLFGTVWGIMNTFRTIGVKGTDIKAIGGPMAEALIATAIGLVAAIPAVMAFNYFTRRVKVLSAEMESFSNDFLNIVKRHFLR